MAHLLPMRLNSFIRKFYEKREYRTRLELLIFQVALHTTIYNLLLRPK